MKVKLWGVRGSLPGLSNPHEVKENVTLLLKSFIQSGYTSVEDVEPFLNSLHPTDVNGYGAATTCVEVADGEHELIIDGGSGIRYISDRHAKQGFKKKHFHILITHFHFDHILGLPFFVPHFLKGHKITYYSVHKECADIVQQMFKRPLFPVGYEDLQADIEFVTLKPYETVTIDTFAVTAYKLDHPDPCYGFRIEKNGCSYAHAVDTEALRVTRSELQKDCGLYEKADLLYIDTQYLEEQMSARQGWGHGTFERAFMIGQEFNIKKVLMAHYDPSASFKDISEFKKKAFESFQKAPVALTFDWDFAYESQEIDLSLLKKSK